MLIDLVLLLAQGRIDAQGIELALAAPVFEMPRFSVASLLGVALPLFLITQLEPNTWAYWCCAMTVTRSAPTPS